MDKKIGFIKNKKSFAFSTIAVILIVAVISITVIFNIVFANLVPHNIDLTSTKEFSMSEQAKDYVKTVDKEVEIIGLFDEVTKNLGMPVDVFEEFVYRNIDKIMEVLNQFHLTNNNIKVSYVNPEKNVLFLQNKIGAERAKDFQKGDFLVMHGNKVKRVVCEDLVYPDFMFYEILPNYDSAFVSAIMYVTSEEDQVIGFVTDHGEYSIDNEFILVKKELENRAYSLKNIKLATDNLDDCDIVVFLGSENDITNDEAEKLTKYLQGGGHAIFLIEANGKDFENLNKVLSDYNVSLSNDLIEESVDNAAYQNTFWLHEELDLANDHPLSEIAGKFVIFPESRSVNELKETLSYLKSYPLVYTSTKAASYDFTTEEKLTEGKKLLGTMVESNATTNVSKIMVMGSTKFAALTDNGKDLLVKTVNWMKESEGGFFVPIKRSEVPSFNITASKVTVIVIVIACIVLLIFAIGTFIWLRRRHL